MPIDLLEKKEPKDLLAEFDPKDLLGKKTLPVDIGKIGKDMALSMLNPVAGPISTIPSVRKAITSQPALNVATGMTGMPISAAEKVIDTTPETVTRSLGRYGLEFVNTSLFGIPETIAYKQGYNWPTPEDPYEQIAGAMGSLTGFVLGPIKFGRLMAPRLPVVGRAFRPIRTFSQAIVKPILRQSATLGTAQALTLKPETNFVGRFGAGYIAGGMLAGLSYIPSKVGRILATSSLLGVPSTLHNEPLEEQIFNYGLGAYFGRHRINPRQVLKTEKMMDDLLRYGVDDVECKRITGEQQKLIDSLKSDVKLYGPEPKTKEGYLEDMILKGGKRHYEPAWGGWRKEAIGFICHKLNNVVNSKSYHLRNDDIKDIIGVLGLKGKVSYKALEKLNDTQIYNLREICNNHQQVEPEKVFQSRPPLKTTQNWLRDWTRRINLWDITLRPGYKFMKKLGHGNVFQKGLTGLIFQSDVDQEVFLNRHRGLMSNWQKMIGLSKEASRNVFLYMDGRIEAKKLTPRQLTVANQMRQYYDKILESANRHRAQYKQEPIKPRDSYITHIFDAMTTEMLKQRHPFPDYLADVLKYVPLREKKTPYFKERKGHYRIGLIEDAWRALDAYAFSMAPVLHDDPIRRSNSILKWVRREIRYQHNIGKSTNIDWKAIRNYTDDYVRDWAGRPGKIDQVIRQTIDPINKILGTHFGIQMPATLSGLSDIYRGLVYTAYMGYRPKLALRNLGQHSLIIGETGPKYLLQAINLRRSNPVKFQEVARKSRVLQSRASTYSAEVPLKRMSRIQKSAMTWYRGADKINVQDSFVAGYLEGQATGKNPTMRGDQVAAKTQYLYLKGNRSMLARGFGLSSIMGRHMGMFTTWPSNFVELMVSWAKPGQRKALLRYFTLNAALLPLKALGIATGAYTGLTSVRQILSMAQGEPFPTVKFATDFTKKGFKTVGAIRDILRTMDKDDLKELILYTTEK